MCFCIVEPASLGFILFLPLLGFFNVKKSFNVSDGRFCSRGVQEQTTADLLFDSATIVSTISQQVTLQPGDLIFTGTPGSTRKMNPGDVVEVEIESIGVLRNTVTAG